MRLIQTDDIEDPGATEAELLNRPEPTIAELVGDDQQLGRSAGPGLGELGSR